MLRNAGLEHKRSAGTGLRGPCLVLHLVSHSGPLAATGNLQGGEDKGRLLLHLLIQMHAASITK